MTAIFKAEEQFQIAGRGLTFVGRSIWNFRDREAMKAVEGTECAVDFGGSVQQFIVAGFETFALIHGPDIGDKIGVLVKPVAAKEAIRLYDKCWVKTERGSILGPLRPSGNHTRWRDVASPSAKPVFEAEDGVFWFEDGSPSGGNELVTEPSPVTSVYSSLAEAAAANPEM